jgi:flavin-dependent dehydrogenase
VIGGGPAGLMAAEVLAQGGVQVDLYDAMPSVGASSCWPAWAA